MTTTSGGDVIDRIVIDDLRPRTPSGTFPAKASVGEVVQVSATIFTDGHDRLAAQVKWRGWGARNGDWLVAPMVDRGNDHWDASVGFTEIGAYEVVVEAWVDHLETWRHDARLKMAAGQDMETELSEVALLLEDALAGLSGDDREVVSRALGVLRSSCAERVRLDAALDEDLAAALEGRGPAGEVGGSASMRVWVDRERARFSTWYELFPRSEGGFVGTAERLAGVAAMGFDVVYLPPIHPIGETCRKGRDNTLRAEPGDVGSPWAIGSALGGHDAIHPDLGTEADFKDLLNEAASLGMEIALDYALQCSPDHPWVTEHPEWFHHRPDGTIKYAENPPKKYQDIYPINFWPAAEEDRRALWDACRLILDHWIGLGVRIFRVDNPHTKPMAFWAWLIPEIQRAYPEVIFLAEAFTRPKVMAKLAEVGFTQSYTYFTWRTAKHELVSYVTELASGPTADWLRPNFWPNTPDILADPLRDGSLAAFRLRVLLAATLVPSYGIYSGYELGENQPQSDTNEEYRNSEKYELKRRDWNAADSIAPFIARVNRVRRRHPALQQLRGTMMHHGDNDLVLAYSRFTIDRSDVVLCVVNLDPYGAHHDMITIDLAELGLPEHDAYEAHDEMTGATYVWHGRTNYVRLDPNDQPGHVFHLRVAP